MLGGLQHNQRPSDLQEEHKEEGTKRKNAKGVGFAINPASYACATFPSSTSSFINSSSLEQKFSLVPEGSPLPTSPDKISVADRVEQRRKMLIDQVCVSRLHHLCLFSFIWVLIFFFIA